MPKWKNWKDKIPASSVLLYCWELADKEAFSNKILSSNMQVYILKQGKKNKAFTRFECNFRKKKSKVADLATQWGIKAEFTKQKQKMWWNRHKYTSASVGVHGG